MSPAASRKPALPGERDPRGPLRHLLTDLAFSLVFAAIAGGVGWAFWPQ